MRKTISLILVLFIISHWSNRNVYAQRSVLDSLLVELQETNTDSSKVDILNELTTSLRRSYPDSALFFAKQAELLAEKINDIDRLAECYKNIGNIYNGKDNFNIANNYYQKSLKIHQDQGNTLGIAKIYNNLGALNRNQGNFILALEYYQKSLELRQKIGDIEGMGKTYNNIGNIHNSQDNFDLAIMYYIKSLDIRKEFNDQLGISGCYNNIGRVNISKGKYQLAIEYFQKSILIYEKFEDKLGIGQCYNNIGNAYLSIENFLKALEYSEKSLEISKKLGDKIGISTSLTMIAKAHNKLGNYELAKNYSERSIIIANEVGALIIKKDAYEQLSIAYEGLSDSQKALQYHKLFLITKDSLFSVEKMKELGSIEAKYQAEKKQLLIENLEQENQLKTVELEKMHIRQIFSYIIISVFIFIIISLIIIRNKLRHKNLTIFEQNEEITTQKDELEIHRNHLEKLVKERTRELEIAKDKAEESDRLKSAFLANMSHEIRTPMNAIIGFSSLISDSDLSQKQKNDMSNHIKNNGDTLLHLIDDIIDLSKIESRQLKIIERECNIDEIFKILFETFSEKKDILSKDNINIIVNNKLEKEQLKLHTDPFRLQQVLSNLIDNAIKFTEKGSVEFGCSFNTKNNKELIFHIKDTGIGLSSDQQNKIFDRFNKVEHDTNKLYRGTGLGLSISKNIVELLGGKLWVESEKDKGSNFYFTLPLTKLAK